jgi:hypothetical protein
MNFEELTRAIAETTVLAKSLSSASAGGVDTSTIAAAAADGAAAGGDEGQTGDEDDEDENKDGVENGAGAGNGDVGDGTETPLGKSFKLQLEDGTEMEAFDGTEMLKALTTEFEAEKAGRVTDNETYLKSFGATIELVTTLTQSLVDARTAADASRLDITALQASNATLVKSLNALANTGRGRASTLTVLEKPNGQPAAAEVVPDKREILAKAMTALSAKRITGTEATKVEAALNAGRPPQQEILDRIFGN